MSSLTVYCSSAASDRWPQNLRRGRQGAREVRFLDSHGELGGVNAAALPAVAPDSTRRDR